MTHLKIYIVAGEQSGDLLGARLMLALQKMHPSISFFGVGGTKMTDAGLNSLFPMDELSLMGFAEIIPHIPKLLKRINQTANHIKEINPDILITIDSPGFNTRLAKRVNRGKFPLVHYVAPSVWVYNPGRAKKFAKLFDHLLTLLPFEPPYFEKEGLAATFVGHPVVEEAATDGNKENFYKKYNIPQGAFVLLAMPGSRRTEVNRLLPIYNDCFNLLQESIPNLYIVIPAIASLKQQIIESTKDNKAKIIIINAENLSDKFDAMAASDFALVKSGTSSLEVAKAKLAMIITYRVSFISYLIIKLWANITSITLINLVSKKNIIPEFLQYDCTAKNLSDSILRFKNNPTLIEKQKAENQTALGLLQNGSNILPSQKAAEVVLKISHDHRLQQ